MKQKTHQLLSAFTLFEWGGIMLYFYWSGRLVEFLHPSFHWLVLTVGILLVLTAALFLFGSGEHTHSHEIEEDAEADGDCGSPHHADDCGHDHHGSLSFKTLGSFGILLLPFALAAWIAPSGFSATKIHNSQMLDDAQSVPLIGDVSRRMELSQRFASTSTPTDNRQPPAGYEKVGQSTPPGLKVYPAPEIKFDGPSQNVPEPPLPSQNGTSTPSVAVQSTTDTASSDQDDPLKPDKNGNVHVEVIDLLYGAQDSSIRQDLSSKSLTVRGQYLPATGATAGPGHFKLMRLFMVCCAADAQPVTVLVDDSKVKAAKPHTEMEWLDVTGKVTFQKHGDSLTPTLVATHVDSIKEPDNPFLY